MYCVSFGASTDILLPFVIHTGNQRSNHTWDLKYVSCGVDSTSADAISRWRRIWRKDGLFLGLQFLQIQDGKDNCVHLHCEINQVLKTNRQTPVCACHSYCSFSATHVFFCLYSNCPSPWIAHQHCLRRILKPSGQLSGMGSWRLLFPTPQMMADESTSL